MNIIIISKVNLRIYLHLLFINRNQSRVGIVMKLYNYMIVE